MKDKKGLPRIRWSIWVITVIFFLFTSLVWGKDELFLTEDHLFLTGIIKSYDKQKGIIWVNVLSESCRGLREFKLPENAKHDLDPSLIGQKIDFSINSPVCESERLYNMILR